MSYPPLRVGRPVWLRHLHAQPIRYPALRGHRSVEVAVVGGGFSGALIALSMAEAGARVALLEGARIARGSTAASTALLLQEPDIDLETLAGRYGATASRRIWQISSTAARDLIHTISRLGIDCNLVERPSVYYTTRLERVESLRDELNRRHAAGIGGQWLSPGRVRAITGMTAAGAILTHGNAQFDPYRACMGLVRAAAAAGVQVHEQTPVSRIRPAGNGVRMHTPHGTVDAATVVIATGYATPHFRPLAGRFEMRRTYVLATKPLTAGQRREVGLGPVLLWDTERPYHYARWTHDHRLLLGGNDRRARPGARRSALFATATRELRGYFRTIYPALAGVAIDHAWEGLFAMTPDSLPYIGPHRRYPRHVFALGYGGNGMTFAALAARMLRERWQGRSSPDHELFAFGRG